MLYCDKCIQFGNDVNNSVKHLPEDCPEFGIPQVHHGVDLEIKVENWGEAEERAGDVWYKDEQGIIHATKEQFAGFLSEQRGTTIREALDYIDNWSKKNPPIDWSNTKSPGVDLTPKQQATVPKPTWSHGVVHKYFPNRNYGFIRPVCDGLDVFLHLKNCIGGYTPVEGDKVIYLTRWGSHTLYALEVKLLKSGLIVKESEGFTLYDQLYDRS